MNPVTTSRRQFMGSLSAAAATMGAKLLASTQANPGGLPTRLLGRTGERVPILCLGGWHIGAMKDGKEAIRIMHSAIDQGITFFDNCWDYQDGHSEKLMGRALASEGRRQKIFLMTKNCERDYAGSLKNLEDSLRRLRTDYVDLWQFHELVYDNDPDWVFEKGGLKAALEARRQGKVRYIGFTGHKDPRIHLKMLEKPFDWDTAQMPINVMDAHYRSFQNEVVPVCLQRNVGVLGMKSLGGGFPRGAITGTTDLAAEECIRYALSLPISSLVVGITSQQDLKQDLAIARDFQPLSSSAMGALAARAKPWAGDGRCEQFKSTQNFDGPHHRRQHDFATD